MSAIVKFNSMKNKSDSMEKHKIMIVTLISLLMLVNSSQAVEYTVDTNTEIDEIYATCYGPDERGMIFPMFQNGNETNCTGSNVVEEFCTRHTVLENLDNMNNEISIRISPIVDNTPCPAPSEPSINYVTVSVSPNGDESLSEEYNFDMNECWGWWCANGTSYNETHCIYDLDSIQNIPVLNDIFCREIYTVDGESARANCPVHTFAVKPETEWINVSWDWYDSNEYQESFYLEFMTFSTSSRSKIITTEYDTLVTIKPTHNVIVSAIGNIMVFNSNIISILFSISEVVIIMVSVVMLPAIVLLVLKWAFEKATGRKLKFRRSRQ